MDQFIGKFVFTSSDNLNAYIKECGLEDKIKSCNLRPRALEVSKVGAVYRNTMFTHDMPVVNEFELDKEFDATLPDGTPCRAVVTLDGNRLVETRSRRGVKEIEIYREFVGNELRMVINVGPVVAVLTFARQ
ncbi:unnamed protein product [Oppiella nova]|uniref:Uncharacterized protein n=1 Tax=Oppiella nova TaxID=334625 RepID=A0A7R9LQH5_9ACAR|nr:unnamed protein product [Oppiella nova]CAG2165975.1 unnamed protein product [Oppiella nova]